MISFTKHDLAKMSKDLALILEEAERTKIYPLISNFQNELSCYEMELLSYTSVSSEHINSSLSLELEQKRTRKKEVLGSQEKKGVKTNSQFANLAPNYTCSLCKHKQYPVKKYLHLPEDEKKKLPVLFLYYNVRIDVSTSTQKGFLQKDNSDKSIFQTELETKIFSELLAPFKLSLKNFYFQEFPACHFNPYRSLPDDWFARSQNCLKYVSQTIKTHKIKKLVLIGNSALALLGAVEAQKKVLSNKSFEYAILDDKINCIVLRSATSLAKIFEQMSIIKDENKKAKLIENENSIKEGLQKALKEILTNL